jgi:hypothetical protein
MLLTVAMANAFYDSSAFIGITGQVATNQYDSGALQEEYRHYQADYPSMAKVIAKRSFQAHSVEDLAKFLPKAFKLARTGRPGPVHVDVPYDLWIRKGEVEVAEPEEHSEMLNWRTPGSPEAVERALDLLLSARTFDAAEARELGLVSRVVPRDEVLAAAQAYARDLASNCSPRAMAVIASQVLHAQDSTFDEALQASYDHVDRFIGSADLREGVASFLERRPPRFAPLRRHLD